MADKQQPDETKNAVAEAVCSSDADGLIFSMQLEPRETFLSDVQLLSFQVALVELGDVGENRKSLLRHRFGLLTKDAQFKPFLYEDIDNDDQDGSYFSIVINTLESGMDAALRCMRKALMIMTTDGVLSQQQAAPYFAYIGGLAEKQDDIPDGTGARGRLITGLFANAGRKKLENDG